MSIEAKESYIQYSAASADISPAREIDLGSFRSKNEPWTGIESRLEANVLVVWSLKDQDPVLIVSLDLLYAGRILRSVIEKAAYPLGANQILVVASHTHRAPMTDDTKPRLGIVDSDYMGFLSSKLSEMVTSVLSSVPELATVHVGHSEASHSVNRRKQNKGLRSLIWPATNVTMAPNPDGPTDENLYSLTLRALDGKPLALIWNYACHPVGGPTRNGLSSHYPGHIRDLARKTLGSPELPIIFLQGFSGDTRPSATAQNIIKFKQITLPISRRTFKDMTPKMFSDWSTSLAEVLIKSIRSSRQVKIEEITAKRISMPAKEFADGLELDPVTFARIDFGEEVTLIAASGEMVAEYSSKVRTLFPKKDVLCVGCADHVLGYLPTANVQSLGGYEGRDFCKAFGLERLQPALEEKVMDAIKRLN